MDRGIWGIAGRKMQLFLRNSRASLTMRSRSFEVGRASTCDGSLSIHGAGYTHQRSPHYTVLESAKENHILYMLHLAARWCCDSTGVTSVSQASSVWDNKIRAPFCIGTGFSDVIRLRCLSPMLDPDCKLCIIGGGSASLRTPLGDTTCKCPALLVLQMQAQQRFWQPIYNPLNHIIHRVQ